MRTYFDDSLPELVRVILEHFGPEAASNGTFHRDSRGQLSFFSPVSLSTDLKERAAAAASLRVTPYIRTDRAIVDVLDVGAERVLASASKLHLRIDEVPIQLLDRRTVGADWLQAPEAIQSAGPKRFVFMSLKGGVGRSTALSIAAAHFASRGLRVLVVDLDMEAPGMGAMLLDETTMPRFGVVDALVENSFGALTKEFLADLTGPSSLTSRGRIDVMPAFGRSFITNPGDVLAKIARAYVEDVAEDGSVLSMRVQIRNLLDDVATADRYDVMLVDARAGLNESSAAPVLGLGADVLLFGLNEPQTFYGYAALLAHLRRLLPPQGTEKPVWPAQISVVHAKAGGEADIQDFAVKWRDLVRRTWLQNSAVASAGVPVPAEPFNDVPWIEDQDLPEQPNEAESDDAFGAPIPIAHDARFFNFDPATKKSTLTAAEYGTVYEPFLKKLDLQLGLKSSTND